MKVIKALETILIYIYVCSILICSFASGGGPGPRRDMAPGRRLLAGLYIYG
jgi:hypothetical protein